MIRRLLSLVLLLGLLGGATPQVALAYDPYQGVNCSGSQSTSAVCAQKKLCPGGSNGSQSSCNPLYGPHGLLVEITNFVAIIAGIAAVILIIVAGIKYATSGGDTNDVAEAKRTIIGTLVGLFIIVLARTLINYVVKRI